jgi:hypothetical protein
MQGYKHADAEGVSKHALLASHPSTPALDGAQGAQDACCQYNCIRLHLNAHPTRARVWATEVGGSSCTAHEALYKSW